MGVVVVVEVHSTVGVRAARVQRIGRGKLGWGMREVGVKGVGCLKHGQPHSAPLFNPAPTASPTSSPSRCTVQSGGIHDQQLTT